MSRKTETAAAGKGLRDARAGVTIFADSTGLDNMQQLIQLRWIAVVGQIVTIAVVHFGLQIRLPLQHMSAVLACLVAFNIASLLRWRAHREVTNGTLFVVWTCNGGANQQWSRS